MNTDAEDLAGVQWGAWADTCLSLGYYQDTIKTNYVDDYWQCRRDAEAGDERAMKYLAHFAAELLKR